MCNDRNTAADQILKTIEYGLLPVAEIERRLEQTLNEALAGPIGAEYDSVKAELCCSIPGPRSILKHVPEQSKNVSCGDTLRGNAAGSFCCAVWEPPPSCSSCLGD